MKLRALSNEHLVGLNGHENVQVAGRATVGARIPFALQAKPNAGIDAGGHFDFEFLAIVDRPDPVAGRAELLGHLAATVASSTGGRDHETAAPLDDLTTARANRTGYQHAVFGPGPTARRAADGLFDLDLAARACERLFEGDFEVVPEVGTDRGPRPALKTAEALPTEELRKQVAELTKNIAEVSGEAGLKTAGLETIETRTVVQRSLALVGEHLVGLGSLLESLFGLRITLIAVRVILHCELTVGRLEHPGFDVLRNAQNLIVIPLGRHVGAVVRHRRPVVKPCFRHNRRIRSRMGTRGIMGPLALVFATFVTGCVSAPDPQTTEAVSPSPPPTPRADLVLRGGRVHTLDSQAPTASAIAIKDGRIVAVGDGDAVKTWIGPQTRMVELSGRTVVPGLVDSHLHLIGLGKRRTELNLVGTTSLEGVLAKLKAAVKNTPANGWVRGRGWDQNDWTDHRGFPSAADLDRVSPKNPVVLTRIDGHALWANSAAMTLAGIDRSTTAPAGGQIVKRRGKPTGIFVDNAMGLILGHVPPYTPEQLEEAILRGQEDCMSAGLTQVHEMGIGPQELAALRKLDNEGRLRLRVYVMIDGALEDLTPYMSAGPEIPSEDHRLTVRGLKFYMDGALGSRGAALLKPYADARKQTGLFLTAPELLEARIRTAKTHGFQVAVHAIGDRANREVLDIFERVYGRDNGQHRPRIEHVQILSLDDVPRFAELGVIASVQPTHATSDMPWAEKRVGPQRIRGAYAWRSLIDSGARMASGSDAPVEDVSPLLGLYAAITRKDLLGFPKGGWYPSERMRPIEAIASFSAGGAYASFREKEAGRIAPGFVADLTVINKDPLTASEDELASMQAIMTIIGGRVEYAQPGAELPPPTATTTSSTTDQAAP